MNRWFLVPLMPVVVMALLALGACQTSSDRADRMQAHPTVPVQQSELAAPPAAPQAPEEDVAYVPVAPPQSVPAESAAPAPAELAPQARVDGPMRIHSAPSADTTAQDWSLETTRPARTASAGDRLEFLDWFGASNTARISNPAANLRLSRESPASVETATVEEAPSYPVVVGDEGRLMPTFNGELQPPPGADQLTTGSIGASAPAAGARFEAPRDLAVEQSALPAPTRVASAAPAEPAPAPRPTGPRRTSPETLRFAAGQLNLDQTHRDMLDRIAEARETDGGRIHVYGISRGVNGTRSQSADRVRRLVQRTGQVAQYLAARGVASRDVIIRTSEEQLPSSAAGNPDQDRIEIFVE